MPSLIVVTRRLLWIALVAIAGGVILGWLRDRRATPSGAPAEWPPLEPDTASAAPLATAAAVPAAAAADSGRPEPAPGSGAASPGAGREAAAAPTGGPATSTEPPGSTLWMEPTDDGSCPDGYPVKAKAGSGIFHVPGGRFYERTKPDRCYASAADAEADGYRRSKS